MSPLTDTGRSDRRNLPDFWVRFRPEAVNPGFPMEVRDAAILAVTGSKMYITTRPITGSTTTRSGRQLLLRNARLGALREMVYFGDACFFASALISGCGEKFCPQRQKSNLDENRNRLPVPDAPSLFSRRPHRYSAPMVVILYGFQIRSAAT